MILRLERLGLAVRDVDQTRRTFRDLFGLEGRAEEPDPLIGVHKAASIPFANACSLYVMESRDPASSVHRYLQQKGPGLERIVLQTDDIQEDYARIKKAGVEILDGPVHHTTFGDRLVVPSEYVLGITVELIQRKEPSVDSDRKPNRSHVLGLQHIGVAIPDLEEASGRFKQLFDLEARELRTDQHGGEQKDAMIEPGNDRLWLHLTESWGPNARVRQFMEEKGPGLEHICIEVCDIREAVLRVVGRGVPIHDHKIFTNREDGFEAFVYPEHTSVTVELIEPFPTSRGYRAKKQCPDHG
jgi:methylmalonyl-CoA/ethylmalonyl-CoA epimerase